MSIGLSFIDYGVIIGYFLLIFVVAALITKNRGDESGDYFLAGRNLHWFLIGSSLFASNIGSEHLIGLAGSGAKGGIAVAQFEILAGIILLLLGWVFVPFYLRSGVTTMPEFLELRYDKRSRNYLSFISIVAYILTKISVTIFAGAVVFEAIGMEFWTGAFAVVLATGIYTVFGGLKAVIYTDMIQMIIMIFGPIIATIIGLDKLGGVDVLKTSVGPEFFSLWRGMSDPEFPWTGILFGAPILGVWYWCTDQFIVQRVLSAKNISHARKATIFGGLLKQLPLFIFVIPGVLSFALAKQGYYTLDNPDHALVALIANVLPAGVRGVMVAGLLAALMSSLSSVFNSCSTLITYDFYLKRNPTASEKQLVKVGQVSTIILVLAGMAWIPLMKFVSGSLFTYLQSVQAYISPPIAAVFLLGLFIKRLTPTGAIASLYTGLVLGVGRLALEMTIKMTQIELPAFIHYIAEINFLHFALLLFAICSVVLIAVSMITEAKVSDEVDRVFYDKSKAADMDDSAKGDLSWSLLLIAIILFIWWYFS